jgi:RNA polymerase sigma factor (sigma-70 family)
MQVGADTDAGLIDASRRGECGAFAQIIERYQRAVHAVSFSSVRDRALADDITQETFVVAWRRLGELRDPSRLPAWLCGIARNLGRDAHNRRCRETLGEPIEPVDPLTPFEVMSEAESERIVATALGHVPDVYREPLVLYYVEERSIDDVARSLGISAATTNKRLSRGRRCLAERVALVVERQLPRHGPRPGLAASVLALIGVLGSASHVDASPVKGSTMHKLTIAAVVTATLGGAGLLAIPAARRSAHANTAPRAISGEHVRDSVAAASQKAAPAAAPACDAWKHLFAAPEHAPGADGAATTTSAVAGAEGSNDCATVGRHLAELEGDVTHGPTHRPDEATCALCASHYSRQCENDQWSAERRSCALAAGDLMNAHLCAGGAPAQSGTTDDVPPNLTCAILATHIATTVQSAGHFADVTDMPTQLEAACSMGNWPLVLRQCFAAASTTDALQECVVPPAQ